MGGLADKPADFRIEPFLTLPRVQEVEVRVGHLRHDLVVEHLAFIELSFQFLELSSGKHEDILTRRLADAPPRQGRNLRDESTVCGVDGTLIFRNAVTAMPARALSPEELALVFRSITEYAIFTLDTEGRITSWNEGAERLFGQTTDDVLGESTAVLFTPEDRERGAHLGEMRQARESGRADDERYHVRKDRSRFYCSGLLFPVRDHTGTVSGFVKVCRDLTDRKLQEQALLEAHETLEQRVAERTAQLSKELAERRAAEERARMVLSRLITLQEEERRRIARDLHDHLGQQVTAVHLQLETLRKRLEAEGSESAQQLEVAHATFKKLDKDLDFFTWELRPGALYNLGLIAALTDFTAAFSQNYSLPVTFECVALNDGELHQDIEIHLYRIAQEALNNTYKHAQASRADVLLQKSDGRVVLTISDDGVGFVPDEQQHRQPLDRGMGLIGMRERATLLGGTLEIETKPNEGTSVIAIIPLKALERAKS